MLAPEQCDKAGSNGHFSRREPRAPISSLVPSLLAYAGFSTVARCFRPVRAAMSIYVGPMPAPCSPGRSLGEPLSLIHISAACSSSAGVWISLRSNLIAPKELRHPAAL